MILTEYVKYRNKLIRVEDLKPNSHIEVDVQCPICNNIRTTHYKQLINNGHHVCQKCALSLKNSKPINYGEKFNNWTVIKNSNTIGYSICKCICGTIREVDNYTLRSGTSKSCGCLTIEIHKNQRKYLEIGTKYNRLTIIDHSKTSGYSICKCDCGKVCSVNDYRLENGLTKSCGCLHSEVSSQIMKTVVANYKGDKHPNWKGGISSERKLYMQTNEYQNWRKEVFNRDDYTCQCCHQHGGELNAHHIECYSENVDKRIDIDNGITLCKECHIKFHSIYGRKNNSKNQIIEFIKLSNSVLSN